MNGNHSISEILIQKLFLFGLQADADLLTTATTSVKFDLKIYDSSNILVVNFQRSYSTINTVTEDVYELG